MYFIYLLIIINISLPKPRKECPPCSIIINSKSDYKNKIDYKWPKIESNSTIKINSLTKVLYSEDNDYQYWESSNRESWWSNYRSDPWTEKANWIRNYDKPIHDFESYVNDNLRYKCGYSYVLNIPKNYNKNKKYPLVISLHGAIKNNSYTLQSRSNYGKNFFVPEDDEYIIATPIKLGIDWSPNKINDVINDILPNIKIDEKRIYLTGRSMGGRGTFIVASGLPDKFAAIMPFSPHHTPYSYKELAPKVSHLPIYLHHSRNDNVSSFQLAEKTFNEIQQNNKNIIFDVRNFGHSGWTKLYNDEKIIRWMLSWKK